MFVGSLYVHESTLSVMNCLKSCVRSQLRGKHLASLLRVPTSDMTPDFEGLSKRGRGVSCHIGSFIKNLPVISPSHRLDIELLG